ncbi:hypothetical protein T484DRAFT_1774225 [Baffinella frigidus]|nr:hypothetical protein T484DRAFT_1774225 [Cryptophyta sp. CCMP2293]
MCKRTAVPLLVNNAYGCQSDVVMKALTRAATRGRVDGIVQCDPARQSDFVVKALTRERRERFASARADGSTTASSK